MAPVTGRFAADFPAYTAEQLFDLAADVERYPEFIPWCRRARILKDEGGVLEVDNHFGAGPVDAGFRSRAVPERPHRLAISSTDAPFRLFELVWSFAPAGTGCRVVADYRLELRSPLIQGLARLAMPEAERKIVRRFRDRAAEIYGG